MDLPQRPGCIPDFVPDRAIYPLAQDMYLWKLAGGARIVIGYQHPDGTVEQMLFEGPAFRSLLDHIQSHQERYRTQVASFEHWKSHIAWCAARTTHTET